MKVLIEGTNWMNQLINTRHYQMVLDKNQGSRILPQVVPCSKAGSPKTIKLLLTSLMS